MQSNSENIKKVGELIKGIKFAMLATITEEGHIHSRPMTTQEVEFDGSLWFFTGKNSPLHADIEHNEKVNLAYANPNGNSYVSICGEAEYVDDKAKIKELWKPALKAWFPEGIDDPNLTLLRVDAHSAQYWDSPASPVVQLIGFAKAVITGQRYSGGESAKVEIN